MSRKTSTAALDTFRQRFLSNPRRVPRHPVGEKLAEIRQAQLAVSQEGDMRSAGQKRQTRSFRTILPVVLRVAFSLFLWTLGTAGGPPFRAFLRKGEAAFRYHPTAVIPTQAAVLRSLRRRDLLFTRRLHTKRQKTTRS